MRLTDIPFQVCNDGKCDTCEDIKPLDTMVRKHYKKGLYECIDCHVEKEITNLKYLYPKHVKLADIKDSSMSRMERLKIWVSG